MLKRSRKPILAAGDASPPASHRMTTSIKYVEKSPRSIRRFEPTPVRQEEIELTAANVEHVAEIFNTPLTGAYNWDYRFADNRIKKLYELGKQLNWNASLDVHWEKTPDWHQAPSWLAVMDAQPSW